MTDLQLDYLGYFTLLMAYIFIVCPIFADSIFQIGDGYLKAVKVGVIASLSLAAVFAVILAIMWSINRFIPL